MSTVADVLLGKGSDVFVIEESEPVLNAVETMIAENIGALVVARDGAVTGIFTERDYAREGEIKGRSAKDTIVGDVMTSQMVLIKPETTLEECAELMGKYHVRHLPVLDKDRVVGVVSIRRLAEGLLAEQKGTIVKLESYILGSGYGE